MKFTLGQRVAFDVEGVKTIDGKPYGFGYITLVSGDFFQLKPDNALAYGMKLTNIRPIEDGKKAA